MVELVYQLYKDHHYIFEEINMTRYIHDLLLNHKDLIDQGEFEQLYNNTLATFKCELTQVLLACGIDPFIDAKKIFNNAFNYSNEEVTYEIAPGITEIEQCAFEGTTINKVTIPSTVTQIGARAFYGCSAQEVNFEPGSQELVIGVNAFENCTRLKNIIIPNRCKIISPFAFRGALLKSCKLSENLIELGDYAFFGTDVAEIEIPQTIKYIGKAPFHNCYYLKKLRCPEKVRGTKNQENLMFGITENIIEWY